jgi:hypothetical protein
VVELTARLGIRLGINLTHQGDAIFVSWFTYDAGGNGWWLSMTANKTARGPTTGP